MIQSTFGNKQIFATGRLNVPFVVLNVMTLFSPVYNIKRLSLAN
jgi:hypothetical protein